MKVSSTISALILLGTTIRYFCWDFETLGVSELFCRFDMMQLVYCFGVLFVLRVEDGLFVVEVHPDRNNKIKIFGLMYNWCVILVRVR